MSTAIDLSKLPPPLFVESLDYEAILADMLADLRDRDPEFTSVSEADPAYKVLEVAAYRELLLRQRMNDEGKALLLAFAFDADLDHIGVTYYDGEARLVVTPADPDAVPPVAAVYESDESYRRRLLLKDDSYSTAGSDGAYIFHALSADGQVKDASVDSPQPGTTVVYVLSHSGDGTPSAELLATVATRLSHSDVRPLSEEVLVQPATIVNWALDADLYTYSGPDQGLVLQASTDSVTTYIQAHQMLGHDMTLSGLYAGLHVPGVFKAVPNSPLADVVCGIGQAPWCTGINVRIAGVGQ
jgi:phage-related baseplate assembly protein